MVTQVLADSKHQVDLSWSQLTSRTTVVRLWMKLKNNVLQDYVNNELICQ